MATKQNFKDITDEKLVKEEKPTKQNSNWNEFPHAWECCKVLGNLNLQRRLADKMTVLDNERSRGLL